MTTYENTERKRLESALHHFAALQSALARLSLRALRSADVQGMMDDLVQTVADVLRVDFVKVLELQPDGQGFLLRAGVGWQPGLVGRLVIGAGSESQAGYTLISDEPVVVADLASETRFHGPELLLEHGVVSGVSVIIRGSERPFGVLGVHTKRQRRFTEDEVHFLQTAAALLGQAIERMRAERALRESEEHYRTLVELSPAGVIVHIDGRVVFANPAAASILGANSPSDLVGRSVLEFVSEEWVPVIQERWRLLASGKRVPPLEEQMRRLDGGYVDVEVMAAPLTFEEQAAIQIIFNDISARKQREREREAMAAVARALGEGLDLETLLQNLLAAAIHAVPAAEKGTILLAADDELHIRAISGYQDPRILWARFPVNEGYSALAFRERRPLIISDAVGNDDIRYEGEIEEMSSVQSAVVAPLLVQGEAIGVIALDNASRKAAFGEDDLAMLMAYASTAALVIERARLFEELKRTNEELRRSLQTREDMLRTVTHELRTPLTLVHGYAELIESGMIQSPERMHMAVRTILRQAKHLQHLIDQLLFFHQLRRRKLDMRPFPARRWLEALASDWASVLQEAGLTLEARIELDTENICGHEDYLTQVVNNLLSNARKFSPQGGKVWLEARKEGEDILISVRDEGIGIPADELDNIFEQFYQVDSGANRRFKGMGIGLALAKEIVEKHGGRIWAESKGPGQGAMVSFTLPLTEQDECVAMETQED
ncbi:MAG: GAF domain-containing protein [Chloroflexi bacterium]|nr:GAF domain-containing protein [Chloroflexota bacterium]